MILINKNLLKYTFAGILLVELLSFFSFQYPIIAPYVFAVVALAALVVTIKNLEWGIWIVFAELVIGSFGKILVLPVGDWQLPIRMVLWAIVMAVWLVQAIKAKRIAFSHSQLFKPYLILAVVLGWGIVWGIWRGNGLWAIFFDVNNYLYFALVFPVYEILTRRGKACLAQIGTVIASAIAWLSIKTILLFYIFSHELFVLQDVLYAWSRKMQLAEITNIDPNAIISRIFIQSQIWILFGLFVALGYVFCHSGAERSGAIESRNGSYRPSASRMTLILSVLLSSALIMSFSRSFWLAGLASLIIFCGALLFILREKFKRVLFFGAASAGIIGLAILLTFAVAKFPFPPGISSSDFLKNRASQFKEAAANSRVAQIRPLLTAIAKHPAVGSGFGTAGTYQSQDPRVLKNHPDGWYTTTAFELGWLEMWLKIGLLGVGAYLYLLCQIVKAGWKKFGSFGYNSGHSDRYIILGGLFGLMAVVVTHGLSPYLNHPLGIGVVVLVSVLVDNRS